MVEYKTSGEIDAMHAAGQVVARILAAVRAQAAPGVRLAELDATARDVLAEAGAPRQRRAVGWATSAPRSGRSAAARLRHSADFGGHGIGHEMHEDPHVPNIGRPGRGPRLIPGLVIAIEPWFLAGG